jgi:hypothetical protein
LDPDVSNEAKKALEALNPVYAKFVEYDSRG